MVIPGFHIVGEHHSHPDEPAELSDDDVGYIADRFDDIYRRGELLLEPLRWLEIVIRIVKRKYADMINPGWSYSDYNRKARCVVRIPSKRGFDITFGGFWIYREGKRMRKREKPMFTSHGLLLDTGPSARVS